MRPSRALFLLALLPFAAPARALDWPQWRGPNRDNVWLEKGLPDRLPAKLEPRWKRSIGGGYGGIAVVAGRAYVMDRKKGPPEVERVLCLDTASGKALWEHAYPVKYGKLDYGNGPRATPTVHNGRVYTMGALGHLHCLDARSGKVVWARDTGKDFKGVVPTWGHACSPLVDGPRLVVQVGGRPDAGLVALDVNTGKEVWRALSDRPGYSSPVLIDTGRARILAYFTPQHVVALEPGSGKVLWKVPFEGIEYDVSISDVVFGDGVLLAGNYWSGSKAIRVNERGLDPKVAWEGKRLSLLMAAPLVKDGHAYALDRFRGVKCVELKTGEVKWEGWHVTPRDRNPQASFCWVGGNRALVLNTPGELVLAELTPAGHRELGRAKVVGRTWAHPAFAEGCCFARNDEEIVCVPIVGR